MIFSSYENLGLSHYLKTLLSNSVLAVVRKKDINMSDDKAVPENNKKPTTYALNVFGTRAASRDNI